MFFMLDQKRTLLTIFIVVVKIALQTIGITWDEYNLFDLIYTGIFTLRKHSSNINVIAGISLMICNSRKAYF